MKRSIMLTILAAILLSLAITQQISKEPLFRPDSQAVIEFSSVSETDTDKAQYLSKAHKPIFLDILGTSNKLSEKEKKAMSDWRRDIKQLAAENSSDVFLNGQTKEKLCALSFDDGPDAIVTPKVLDILKAYDVKANFFFIGERAKRFSDVTKKVYAEGHLILNHSYSHVDLSKEKEDSISRELLSTEMSIESIIGKKTSLLRPPYGAVNSTLITEALRNGYKIVIWSIDTLDWSQKDKDNITKNVLDNIRPGDIILMHSNEDKSADLEALPLIIEGLRAKGFKIVGLDELLQINAYKN